MADELTALGLVADLRKALGDPLGKLMQDELVAHAEALVAERDRLRTEHAAAMDVLRQIATMPRRTREQRLASACVNFLDALPPNA